MLDGGRSLDLIQILMYMVLCHVFGLVGITEWKKQGVWDGCHGLGRMSTQKTEKEPLKFPKKIKYFCEASYVYEWTDIYPMPGV